MKYRSCLAVVLAAGDSTRMKSSKSKVLHTVGGRPIIAHVMEAIRRSGVHDIALVLGRDAESVERAAALQELSIQSYVQVERLGTAHAVLAAREAITQGYDDILIAYGDVPLISETPFLAAREALAEGHDIAVIGFETAAPTGYGRLLIRDGQLEAIREERDATEEERKVTLCNSGLMAINGKKALDYLSRIGNSNAKSEYYLTDIVEVARANGGSVVVAHADEAELIGCNNRAELAVIESLWQQRRRHELMVSGVSLIAPETVFLSYDTRIDADVTVEPFVRFGPGVTVKSRAVIHSFSHIEGALIEEGAAVGPFARLRPGSKLMPEAKVGNFCEVKNAEIGDGAKVNHLSYIGDASIGSAANIGAGTITCNYDGKNKHRTEIGVGAFIGSNSALVAPVKIGNRSMVAAGSVITDDVPEDSLALGRSRQTVKPGRGAGTR